MRLALVSFILVAIAAPGSSQQQGLSQQQGSSQQQTRGYYRFPAITGHIVFIRRRPVGTPVEGRTARRFTTHPGVETCAAFSPDGKTIAFSANYEGPTEVYTMPATGGLPRRTFEGNAKVVGLDARRQVLFATRRYSTLPDTQLATSIRPTA